MKQPDDKGLTEAQVIKLLLAKCDELGGKMQLAALLNVKPPRLSNVLHGRNRVSEPMLRLLGLKKHRVSVYRYFPKD